MSKLLFSIAGVIILILLLFPFVLIVIGRGQLHDSDIPKQYNLKDFNLPFMLINKKAI